MTRIFEGIGTSTAMTYSKQDGGVESDVLTILDERYKMTDTAELLPHRAGIARRTAVRDMDPASPAHKLLQNPASIPHIQEQLPVVRNS